jgi:hypothetical protein
MRSLVAAAVAVGIGAAACRPEKGTHDSVAVSDTATASSAVNDSTVAPVPGGAPPAEATSGAPNGAAKPATAASRTSMGKATTDQAATTPTVRVPLDTTPRPSNKAPAGATTPALVVFRDSLAQSDIDWLRAEGFAIVNVNEAAHAVSVGVPNGYHGKPKSNPRVLRFTIAMR